eukprot:1893193-Pleurochrysis_carterae.AAC.1
MTMRRAARMLCCLLVHSASAAPVSMVASGVLSAMIMPDRIAWHVRRWHADGAARVRSQRRILDVSRSCATANAAATSTKHLGKLILVRHGESTWNMDNKFTGWADVPLTDEGRAGAHRTAQVLRSEFKETVDVLYTSVLERAVETAQIIIASLESHGHQPIELRQRWRLNERHYGALTGLSKRESGCDDFELFQYRMTLAGRPPAMQPDHPYFTRREAKYVSGELLFVDPEPLALADVPLTESLADTCNRCRPVWEKEVRRKVAHALSFFFIPSPFRTHPRPVRFLVPLLLHTLWVSIISFGRAGCIIALHSTRTAMLGIQFLAILRTVIYEDAPELQSHGSSGSLGEGSDGCKWGNLQAPHEKRHGRSP